ncbi:hypothetical protein [Bradyrhizobium viridifuturi]|uniref:hypothetical protein n=1 Tax=Bradyrhizobium viridifuturi TaxID=1654716 RepID=UPI000FE14629|nr:hypothetical protein [Bradyrhizobium viridifuturi]
MPQRDVDEIDDPLDLAGKAAADPLVNTEDDPMMRRFRQPDAEDIGYPARQHEIIVPLAYPQRRGWKTFRKPCPICVDHWRVGIHGSVMSNVVGSEPGAKPEKQASSTSRVVLFEMINAAPPTPAASVNVFNASGHASGEEAASLMIETREVFGNRILHH